MVSGDKLEFDICLLKECRGIWKFKGIVIVNNELVCSVEFMCVMREIV